MTGLPDFSKDVNDWVAALLDGYEPRIIRQRKLVRDPVIGFETLEPHEIAIVDSPVFQRLRHIRQTALAYQVYPGANHTRLEHCFGVAHRAQQMIQAINDRYPDRVSLARLQEVRLAGLLHDVGHGPFSHLSERIFTDRHQAELRAIELADARFAGRGLGEILSYLIVTCRAFREFTDGVFATHHCKIDLDRVAGYFLGHAEEDEYLFLAQMISGPFDADKLDYFQRDSHYTGLRAELDVERILAVIDIDDRSNDPHRHLVVRRAGVHHFEQIIFSKMILFSSVYHHHKIRALECAVRAVFRKIWDDPSAITEPKLQFRKLASILEMTDDEFWVLARRQESLAPLVRALYERREPPMRALALSLPTMSNRDAGLAMKYQEISEDPARQNEIGKTIQAMLPKDDQVLPFGTWFDFPQSPKVSKDAKATIVDRGDTYVELTDFFPGDEWVGAYQDNKLTAHVFFDPPAEPRRRVSEKAREYFQATFALEFNDIAWKSFFKDGA
jgi:HD superfamily phosphohydrolase